MEYKEEYGQQKIPQTFEEAAQMAVDLEEQRAQLKNLIREQLINERRPKKDYVDCILQHCALVSMSQIAKDYGMSIREMNELLHKLGVQYKCDELWLLYAEHQHRDYTRSYAYESEDEEGRKSMRKRTEWTQKGRLFLYNLLKENGILPLIER